VGKVWAELPWNCGEGAGTKRGIVYFKEKHDLPSLEKIPRMEEKIKFNCLFYLILKFTVQ